jgi:hypothetical protein
VHADLAPRRVRVFERLPGLLAGVPPEVGTAARRHGVAAGIRLEPGRWAPPRDTARYEGWLGLLVVEGLLLRTVAFDDMASEELLGPGDLVRPWDDGGGDASMPWQTSWHVASPATVALLDTRFAGLACRWPAVMVRLLGGAVARAQSRSVHLAMAQARRAEVRLLLLFWHLADRFGHVSGDGVVVPVPLTHERLAGLVCLRRPTVSVALAQLKRSGHVVRRPDGSWRLPTEPPDLDALLRGDELPLAA